MTSPSSRWLRYLDYVFLMRPMLFFPGWATLLAGFLLASFPSPYFLPGMSFQLTFHSLGYPVWLAMLTFALAMGGSFIFNQLRDVDSDRQNRKLFLLGDGHVPLSHGYIQAVLTCLLAMGMALTINRTFALLLLAFILVTGYLYNYAPFELKNRPLWGLWANMAMGWLAFALGWSLAQPLGKSFLLNSLNYLAFNTGLYLLTTLPDRDGDAAARKITFPVKYGFRTTIRWSGLLMAAALVGGGVMKDDLILLISLGTLPFMIWMLRQPTTERAIITLKMGIFFFVLWISMKFPLFFGIALAGFYFTRFYYQRRFNFDYPNFKGR